MNKQEEEDLEHILEPEICGLDENLSGECLNASDGIPASPVDGDNLKGKTRAGTFWSVIERFSVQGITFIVLLVMARLLTPEDYGIVGMIVIFIEVAQSLVDSGFSQALIRKKDRSEVDNSTVFYFNVVVGLVLYAILFFTAPLISNFYDKPEIAPVLIPMIRLLGLSIVINSFVVVQRALFTLDLDFKSQAKASLAAAVGSGCVGIGMALGGFGVWSIAAQQLSNLAVNVSILWILSKWRPKTIYSWSSFRYLFGFGSKLALAGVLEIVYRNIYNIAIGKVYRTSELGYYTRAQQFGNFLSTNVSGVLQRVSYPVLCSLQDEDARLAVIYRKFLRLSAFVIFPLMLGMAALAYPLVIVFLQEKWSFTATLLQILCLSMMWYPVHAINLNLLMVKGRSDLFLGLEVAKKIVGVTIMCITIPIGLEAICWGQVVSSVIALLINTRYTGRLIGVGFLKQMKDLIPTLLYSSSMAIFVWGLTLMIDNNILCLVIGFPLGVAYYFLVARFTGSADLRELISFVKKKK